MSKLAKFRSAIGTAIVLALSVCITDLAKHLIYAQRKAPRSLLVPVILNGKKVESEVVNGVVFIFGDLANAEESDVPEWGADNPIKQKTLVALFSGSLDELAYGSSESGARTRLENRLQQKLQKLDRISGLSQGQWEKLQLAGRGDVKRLMDRAVNLRAKCKAYYEISELNQFQKWAEELRREANSLREPLYAGPFDASDALFLKCMRASLSAEQSEKYARFEATPPYQAPRRQAATLEGALIVP